MLGAERGNEKFISLRDVVTGMPEGLIQFTHPYTDPSTNQKTYAIGYVSGFQNKSIEPKYKNALKAMFNDHADEIRDIGSHAESSGIYDKYHSNHHTLGIQRDQWDAIKDELPRFFIEEDVKAEIAKIKQVAAQQLSSADPVSLQDDVASAIETAISTAGAELEDRNLYREVDARLRQAYGEWAQQFPDNVFAQDPLRAVTHLQGRLDNLANSVPVALRGAFAEARDEVTAVLQGMQIPQRQAQAANAPMTVSDWVEQEIGRIGRADGNDVSAEVRRFVDQATDFYNPDVNTQAFVNSIRGAAGLTDSSLVEENLNAIANYIEQTHIRPAQAQAPAQFDVGPIIMAAREAAQRDLTPDQWNTMVSLLERANNIADARQQPQSFADALNGLITLPSVTRLAGFDDRVARRLTGLVDNITNGITEFDRQQAPAQFDAGPIIMAARERAQRELTSSQWNLIVSFLERANNLADARHDPIGFADAVSSLADIAEHTASTRPVSFRLNQLADSINTAFNEFSQNLGEPEDLGAWEPEEQHAANQPSPTSIARHLVEIEREPDGTLRPQGITTTLQTLRTGQLDHPSLAEHPPGSPERIATGMRIAPIVESMAAQDFSYHDLHYFLSNEERNQINTDSSRIVRQAQSHGVDANETGSMIRRRNDIYGGATVNLDNYSPFALEILRRDVVDSLNAAPQAPAPQAPAPQRNTHDLYIELNEALQNAQDEGSIELQHMPDEAIAQLIENDEIGVFDDLTDAERQSLAQYVRDNGIREPNNPAPQAPAPQAPAPQAPAVGRPFRVTRTNRNDATGIIDTITDNMDDGGLSMQERVDEFDGYLDMLARGVEGLEDIVPQPYEEWNNPEGLRFELMRRFQEERDALQQMIEEEGDDEEPQQFAKGGRVTHTPTTDDMRYELMMRRA